MVDDKQDEFTSPRRIYGRWKVVLFLLFLSTVVVILPLEILELVYRNKSPWINLYGSDDVGDADWCEAIDADLTQYPVVFASDKLCFRARCPKFFSLRFET